MNLLFLLCALLLPVALARGKFNKALVKAVPAILTTCRVNQKITLDGDYYKQCKKGKGLRNVMEIVGCRSKFVDQMLPVGDEWRQVYQDAPGYEEKCVRDKNGVTLSSTVLPSAKQLAANITCSIPREKEQFVEEGVVKRCRYDEEFAVVEIIGCQYRYKYLRMLPTTISIGKSANLEGDNYKCVKDGDSAKLIGGEFERCENRVGQKIVDGNVYKRCILANNEYKIEVVGCVREIPHNYTDILGFEFTVVGGFAERDEDFAIMKCVKEGDSAKFVTGEVHECDNRGQGEFISGNVFKKCIREGDHYTTEVVACVGKFEGSLKILHKFGRFAERLPLNSLHTFRVHGMSAEMKCIKNGDSAVIIAGDLRQCENRTIGVEFVDQSLYKVCNVEGGLYKSEVVGCVSKIKPAGEKLAIGKGVAFRHLDNFELCQKNGDSARLLTGEAARKALEEANKVSVTNKNTTKTDLSGAKIARDLMLCVSRPIGVEFLDESLYKICKIEHFVYKTEIVGCFANLSGSKLSIGKGFSISNKHNFCLKEGDSVRLLTGDEAKQAIEKAGQNASKERTIQNFRNPIHRDIGRCVGQYMDHVYTLKGIVYQCASNEFGSISNAKPVGCVPFIKQYDDDSFIPIGVRKELKTDFYQTCNVPTQTSIQVQIETHHVDKQDKDEIHGNMDIISVMLQDRNLTKACYFNGRQINKGESAFINEFVFTCAEVDRSRLEVKFEGCFTEARPASVGSIGRSKNIAQCDFSKFDKNAEMIIVGASSPF